MPSAKEKFNQSLDSQTNDLLMAILHEMRIANGTVNLEGSLTITLQPQATTQNQGANFSLTAVAVSTGAISIQWVKDGVDIPGAVSSPLNFNNAQPSDSGVYGARFNDPSNIPVYTQLVQVLVIIPSIVFYDAVDGNELPTEAAINDAQHFVQIVHNGNFQLDWTATAGTPKYLKFYIRQSEPTPTNWQDSGNPINQGAIGGIGQFETFNKIGSVPATDDGANWDVYCSDGLQDFGNPVNISH